VKEDVATEEKLRPQIDGNYNNVSSDNGNK
jgi:hypothetical protein